MRIIFMGTPDFAVASLDALVKAGHDIAAVVTMPDKPAGRGQKLMPSAVKKYAVEHGLQVLQPEKLKDEAFLEQLRNINAECQVVVAFRMLPEAVWNMPKHGTYNVHASLLPQYRGAAPINWAVINGDKQTGVTTFKLKHEIDTGDVLMQEAIDILPEDNAGTIHDKLMELGARLIVKTIDAIGHEENLSLVNQDTMANGSELRPAPKIFKPDMQIDWNTNAEQIHNKVRGLSPYPAAWAVFQDSTIKIFATTLTTENTLPPGQFSSDNKSFIRVGTATNDLLITDLQLAGKKRMDVKTFLTGNKIV